MIGYLDDEETSRNFPERELKQTTYSKSKKVIEKVIQMMMNYLIKGQVTEKTINLQNDQLTQ